MPRGRIPEGSFTADTVTSARAGVAGIIEGIVEQLPEEERDELYETLVAPLNMAMVMQMRGSLDEYGSWTYTTEGLTVTATQR